MSDPTIESILNSGPEAGKAYAELARTLCDIEAHWSADPELDAQRQAARRYLVANALQHGFQCWFDFDPARPVFHRWLSATKKLLGDNPDAVYYGTSVDPEQSYVIRGNTMGATYTSFTVEKGVENGTLSQGLVSTLNDTEFDIDDEGNYEIIVSTEPHEKNWLRLEPGAGGITTRHYFEEPYDVAADPTFHIPLSIEPVNNPGPARPMDDAMIAAGIRRVINFVRGTTIDFPEIPEEFMPAWMSREVNQFSGGDNDNEQIGYSAKDIDYRQTVYELDLDQALIMKGRFPRCRFANVVVWNHNLQTPPYINRKVSFNRAQLQYEDDGRFTIVIAHRDPGHPNWIDAAGLTSGMVFWRFLLPEEPIPPIETEVVAVDSLRSRS